MEKKLKIGRLPPTQHFKYLSQLVPAKLDGRRVFT